MSNKLGWIRLDGDLYDLSKAAAIERIVGDSAAVRIQFYHDSMTVRGSLAQTLLSYLDTIDDITDLDLDQCNKPSSSQSNDSQPN